MEINFLLSGGFSGELADRVSERYQDFASCAKVQSDVAKAAIATLCRYNRINPKILQCVPASAGSEVVRTGSMGVIAQL